MKNLGYYNGKQGLIEEITVPITDRAFYFGDGVYDAVMCRNNIPYLLYEHVNRIFKNCFSLGIIPPTTKEELMNLIKSRCPLVDGEEKFVEMLSVWLILMFHLNFMGMTGSAHSGKGKKNEN